MRKTCPRPRSAIARERLAGSESRWRDFADAVPLRARQRGQNRPSRVAQAPTTPQAILPTLRPQCLEDLRGCPHLGISKCAAPERLLIAAPGFQVPILV